jgi:hypothetical protein
MQAYRLAPHDANPALQTPWYRVGVVTMRRALPWLGVVCLFLVAAVAFERRSQHEMYDFEVYRIAGARVAAGEPLYRAEDGHWQFKYLPAFAFVIAPLAALPAAGAKGVWFFLSVALLVVLVNRSLVLLPDRRRTAAFLVGLTILAMGKFYVREVGLGQSNLLLAVLVLAAVAQWRAGRDGAAGALLAAATIVKPYAILFVPYLVVRRRWRDTASFLLVIATALLVPALRYGWSGNLALLQGWWDIVATSTAPNLAGQDNISIAGMYAAWLGVGPVASWLSAGTALLLVVACARAIFQGSGASKPDYLDAALLLFVIPLLSPQGWDYVLLVSTPAVMLLLDRLDAFDRLARWLLLGCLTLAGLTLWDVFGRENYFAFMMSRVLTVCALVEVGLVLRLRVLNAA